ncbi:hypothetical protein J5J83_14495 [Azoarcus sp. L1K30]|uniref:hypothetical protein n=1 Tax=Azoarcus sp. L1K30 TaxID=2820277 RepID=UPI001B8244CD|nr:hypothetical protein [Azoarcus sp. L1K30]MBR0567329.1 hypothetical protein [Azoarcus sp. L1K30]
MDGRRKTHRFMVYQDTLKLAYTSHWDLDYLGQAEFDALMAGAVNDTAPGMPGTVPSTIPDPPEN